MIFENMLTIHGEETAISLLLLTPDAETIASLTTEQWLKMWQKSGERNYPGFREPMIAILASSDTAFLLPCLITLCCSGTSLPAEAFNTLSAHVEAGCSHEDLDCIVAYALRHPGHNASQTAKDSFARLEASVRERLCASDDIEDLLAVCSAGVWSGSDGWFPSSSWSHKYTDTFASQAVEKAVRLCQASLTPLMTWFSVIKGGNRKNHSETNPGSPARRFPNMFLAIVEYLLVQKPDYPFNDMLDLMHMCIRAQHGPAAQLVAAHVVGRLSEWSIRQLLHEIDYTDDYGVRSIGQLCEGLYADMVEYRSFGDNKHGIPMNVSFMRDLHARIFAEALARVSTPPKFCSLLKVLDDSLVDNKRRLRAMRRQVLTKLLTVGVAGCKINDGLLIMREATGFKKLEILIFNLLKELPWAKGNESLLRQRALEAENSLSGFREPTNQLERWIWQQILTEEHPFSWWLEVVVINRWYLCADIQKLLWAKVEACAQSDEEKGALLALLQLPAGKRKGDDPHDYNFGSAQESVVRENLLVWQAEQLASVAECLKVIQVHSSSRVLEAAMARLQVLRTVVETSSQVS